MGRGGLVLYRDWGGLICPESVLFDVMLGVCVCECVWCWGGIRASLSGSGRKGCWSKGRRRWSGDLPSRVFCPIPRHNNPVEPGYLSELRGLLVARYL